MVKNQKKESDVREIANRGCRRLASPMASLIKTKGRYTADKGKGSKTKKKKRGVAGGSPSSGIEKGDRFEPSHRKKKKNNLKGSLG